jgi:hypothetical protein
LSFSLSRDNSSWNAPKLGEDTIVNITEKINISESEIQRLKAFANIVRLKGHSIFEINHKKADSYRKIRSCATFTGSSKGGFIILRIIFFMQEYIIDFPKQLKEASTLVGGY